VDQSCYRSAISSSAEARRSSLERLPTCLIGEDAALVGMALESYLEDQGFICETVCSSSDALRWLDSNTPTVAVLDYLLKDGPCTLLAGILRARGIPFLIYSGVPANAACPELQGATWITKPARREILLDAIVTKIPLSMKGSI